MAKQTIEDLKPEDLKEKTILVRCDFNVPMQDGAIQDDTRVKAAIPTIQYLAEKGAKVVLCSHLGKPKPAEMSSKEMEEKFSLKPVAERLSEELGKEVKFADDLTGDSAKAMISGLSEGNVGLLENTRFDPREEQNDETLSIELADLADIYVNDAFGSAHRGHSSTEGVAKEMEKQGKETALGFLMQKEVEELGAILKEPERPFVAILGGAKVSSKIGVIENLFDKVDAFVFGGLLAVTILEAQGKNVGNYKSDPKELEQAKRILKMADEKGKQIVLPVDLHVAKIPAGEKLTNEVVSKAENMTVHVDDGVPEGYYALDMGMDTFENNANVLDNAKTIFWNGSLGLAEVPEYAIGTGSTARYIAKNTNAKCVVGGGDTVTAVNKAFQEEKAAGEDMRQYENKFYISTGGGASLEYLAGKVLPGIAAIKDRVMVKSVGAGNGQTPIKDAEQLKESQIKE